MDLEYFWAAISWAVVIGGAALAAFVGFYWLVVIPHRVGRR